MELYPHPVSVLTSHMSVQEKHFYGVRPMLSAMYEKFYSSICKPSYTIVLPVLIHGINPDINLNFQIAPILAEEENSCNLKIRKRWYRFLEHLLCRNFWISNSYFLRATELQVW